MQKKYSRRQFIHRASAAGLALGLPGGLPARNAVKAEAGKRVGIIGLDTSHCLHFTRILNAPDAGPEFRGYKVVAAFPRGSLTIQSAYSRIPGYTEDMKNMGVEIVGGIAELLQKTDVILLETNDGRRHLEQALPVLKAGKRMFIDKPVAASLHDVFTIYGLAKHYGVPVFSSSSLRFEKSVQEGVHGKAGKVLGAYTYGYMYLEETHPDLYWYGIHGVEALYTLMGTGCRSLVRVHTEDTDVVVGTWSDGRIGSFRGNRSGKYDSGGIVFGTKANLSLYPSEEGYRPLVAQIAAFFATGVAPVAREETFEIYTFMTAADESRLTNGERIDLEEIKKRGRRKAYAQLKELLG